MTVQEKWDSLPLSGRISVIQAVFPLDYIDNPQAADRVAEMSWGEIPEGQTKNAIAARVRETWRLE